MKTKILSFIITITIVSGMVTACKNKVEDAAVEQAIPVEVQEIRKGDIQIKHSVSARIKPLKEVAVLPKSMGKVEVVYADIGDRVSEGQVLFSLEKKDLNNQLNQIEAQLKQSQANIEAAQVNLESAKGSGLERQVMQAETALKQAEVALEQAETNYETAKRDYETNKLLYESQAISKQVMDNYQNNYNAAEYALRNAKQTYDSALENYELVKNKISVDTIEIAQKQLNQAIAAKEAIEVQREMILQHIADTDVSSPLTGIVSQKTIEAGSLVSQQVPAYTVVEIDKVVIEASVTERNINSISEGQDVLVTVNALGDKEFKGKVDAISPSIPGQSIGYMVKIMVNNPDHQLKPGMFARVEFFTERKEDVLIVPIDSVLAHGDETYVFVVEDNIAKRRIIKTGLKDEKNYEVVEGLEEKEEIIIKGQRFVTDEEKVETLRGEQQ